MQINIQNIYQKMSSNKSYMNIVRCSKYKGFFDHKKSLWHHILLLVI